ncbi:MAG: hypothetical protein QM681_19680 [Novosphingobium sp.]
MLLPTLEAHEQVVRLAERRAKRASEKRAAAMTEERDALLALQDACTDRADWIARAAGDEPVML